VGGEAQQPVPRDVLGVMTPIDGDGSAGAVQPRWSADFWVDDADATTNELRLGEDRFHARAAAGRLEETRSIAREALRRLVDER
jgi:hypothetical protein